MTRIREELLQMYRLVFKESFEVLGIEDVDTWKAANNLTGCLSSFGMFIECYSILSTVLTAGIVAKVRGEGKFKVTLDGLTMNTNNWLESLERSQIQDRLKVEECRRLLHEWIKSSGCTVDVCSHDTLNNQGVYLQWKGEFVEAEREHLYSIELCEQAGKPVPGLYLYNLMLAIARQGRSDEAREFREKHLAKLAAEEAIYGTLQQRVEQSAQDRQVYEEAQVLLQKGKITREGEWWVARKWQLIRAENLYGEIKAQPAVAVESSRTRMRSIFKFR
jgi:hypothetical protein